MLPIAALSPRRRETLKLIVEEDSAMAIAACPGISAPTVASRKYQVVEWPRTENSAELNDFAIKHGLMAVLVCVLFMTGCASRPVPGHWTQVQSDALKNRLLQLGSGVDAEDTTRLAEVAVEQSAALAHRYRAVRPAWLGNYLVNLGWSDRGLCYDWANGLYPRLHELGLRSFELHLAVARMDTPREHNCIVVTAHRQPFAEGVVLDTRRHSGRLWFGDVSTDKYPWQPLPRERIPPELEELLAN